MARPEIGVQWKFRPYEVRPAITNPQTGEGLLVLHRTSEFVNAEQPEAVLFSESLTETVWGTR